MGDSRAAAALAAVPCRLPSVGTFRHDRRGRSHRPPPARTRGANALKRFRKSLFTFHARFERIYIQLLLISLYESPEYRKIPPEFPEKAATDISWRNRNLPAEAGGNGAFQPRRERNRSRSGGERPCPGRRKQSRAPNQPFGERSSRSASGPATQLSQTTQRTSRSGDPGDPAEAEPLAEPPNLTPCERGAPR